MYHSNYGFHRIYKCKLIKSTGAKYIIIGILKIELMENDSIINKKSTALKENLKVIFVLEKNYLKKHLKF